MFQTPETKGPAGFRPRSSWRRGLAATTAILLGATAVSAQVLVRDINPLTDQPAGLGIQKMSSPDGAQAYLLGADDFGQEPWISDGTVGGTQLLKDIYPGPAGSSPSEFFDFDGRVWFLANDGVHGTELWSTDGTEAGTTMLVDLEEGPLGILVEIHAVSGSFLYLSGRPPGGGSGSAVYRTDGTAGGTELVKVLSTDSVSSIRYGTAFDGGLLFAGDDGTSDGLELWFSDGTELGTNLLRDIHPSASSNPGPFLAIGSAALFAADDGTNGRELWRTDGTFAGTTMVADLKPGAADSSPSDLTTFDSVVYFGADGESMGSPTGNELYRTNGTVIQLAADLDGGSLWSRPLQLTAQGATLFFTADVAAQGRELWKYNTTNGAALVGEVAAGPDDGIGFTEKLTLHDGWIYFAGDDGTTGKELWRSDGTTLERVIELDPAGNGIPGAYSIAGLANGQLLFEGCLSIEDCELFSTLGTEVSTTQLSDTVAGAADSDPMNIAALSDGLYFFADDGSGSEPWTSDGTAEGTVQIADLDATFPGPGSFARLGSSTLFITDTDTENDVVFAWNGSDATPLTSGFLAQGPIVVLDDVAVFTDRNEGLWRTDGTPGGTFQIAGIEIWSEPVAFAGEAYFAGDDGGGAGVELWKTDGNTTTLVYDFDPAGDGEPLPLAANSSRLFVAPGIACLGGMDEGGPGGGCGGGDISRGPVPVPELWVTDGTPIGTTLASTVPGTITAWRTLGEQLLFGLDTLDGTQLWQSTGSMATVLLPTAGPSSNRNFVGDGQRVAFLPGMGAGMRGLPTSQIFTSDGTPPGSFVIATGSSCAADELTVAAGRVYFDGCTSGEVDRELWVNDGTVAGTRRAADIEPGLAGSDPRGLVTFGDAIYFSARRFDTGRELYRYDLPLFADGFEAGDSTSWSLTTP